MKDWLRFTAHPSGARGALFVTLAGALVLFSASSQTRADEKPALPQRSQVEKSQEIRLQMATLMRWVPCLAHPSK